MITITRQHVRAKYRTLPLANIKLEHLLHAARMRIQTSHETWKIVEFAHKPPAAAVPA
jgi:hypothetical protein